MTNSNQHKCSGCQEYKPATDFYKRLDRKEGSVQSLCKSCNNKMRIEQTRNNRAKGIQLLGGKCIHCSYDKCQSALHFHHPDPSLKDDAFNRLRNRKWEFIRTALLEQKCVLLCANCHAEEHESTELRSYEEPHVGIEPTTPDLQDRCSAELSF